MKIKKIVIICIITILVLVINSYASNYYDGTSIDIKQMDNMEILLNEVTIDTTTSNVKNIFLIRNTSDTQIEQEVEIQLENNELATQIKDLSIVVNNLNAKYIKDENGIYKFTIKADPGAVKKIEIQYNTENNLKNARIIKYSLDSLKGKLVKALKVDIIVEEEDIPLVKAIYPYNYTFENNTISVRYYNFTVNNLTKDIIIEKDTYSDLKYSREYELNEIEQFIVENSKEWITNGISIDYTKDIDSEYININKTISRLKGIEYNLENFISLEESCSAILDYIEVKQLYKDGKTSKYDFGVGGYGDYQQDKRPLIKSYMYPDKYPNEDMLVGKTICVEYLESEGDKDLYIQKNITGKDFDYDTDMSSALKDVKTSEWEILKAPISWEDIYGAAKIIYIGMDIDGNRIDATEQEKIEYVNMMDTDMYIRIIIYDGNVMTKHVYPNSESEEVISGIIAYYKDEDRGIARAFLDKDNVSGYTDNIERYYTDCVKKFNNEDMANYCEVPAVARARFYRIQENGKYFIESFYAGGVGTRKTLKSAIETSRAQTLIKQNREKNETTKNQIEQEIASVVIIDDIEEPEVVEEVQEEETVVTTEQFNIREIFEKNRDVIVLGTISGLIIICVCILIIKSQKKKKGVKSNGRKESKN